MAQFFTFGNFIKILFLVTVIVLSLYLFFYTRRIGCMDKKALNYDKNMNINDAIINKINSQWFCDI